MLLRIVALLIGILPLFAEEQIPVAIQEILPSATETAPSYEGAFIRMIVTLLGLVVLIFATVWVLRRLSQGGGRFRVNGGGKLIHIVEKRAISPKSMLYILEINGKRLVISESQLEVRFLSSCTEPIQKD